MVFVEKALSMMSKGYAAIIIQNSAGSGKATEYNKTILKHSTLLASIKMPIDLFIGKSSVQTNIYVFRVGEAHQKDDTVKFIEFSVDGYTRTNRKKASCNLRDTDRAKERYAERFDANKVSLVENGGHPYIVRQSTDNGKKGNIDESVSFLNPGNTISFGQDTATMFYQEVPYFTSDKIKILKPKDAEFSKKNAQFFLSSMRKTFSSFAWGSSRFNVETLKEQLIMLPITNHGKIDFTFMESFIADLEEERVAKLSTFLTVSGLDNYELSSEEKDALKNYTSLKWNAYNLEKLFGKATRGKRLKGDDRIAGTLPFVTAGETAEGISAYISNHVEVFEKNTTTIDMFGSAKYRNYQYGADDHVAVVHTESVPMKASIFLTSAIHKAAHTGKFDYGHNFYAKDADALDIMLPTKDGKPDYDAMATLISAVQKLVIQDVVIYADKRI